MKIRIVKASKPTNWYADKIGEVYDVERELKFYGVLKYVTNSVGVINAEDCEEVIEHNSQLYRKVDRPVREGDTVLITKYDNDSVHVVTTIEDIDYEADMAYVEASICNTGYLDLGEDVDWDEYFVLELIDTTPALTETDLIANLAQEVAELKRELSEHKATVAHRGRTLEINVSELKDDIADLEDRLDESEKDTEELIGRINDLGDSAEVAANLVLLVTELREHQVYADKRYDIYEKRGDKEMAQFFDGKATGFKIAARRLEEALRND